MQYNNIQMKKTISRFGANYFALMVSANLNKIGYTVFIYVWIHNKFNMYTVVFKEIFGLRGPKNGYTHRPLSCDLFKATLKDSLTK